jgi:hypothetical protein
MEGEIGLDQLREVWMAISPANYMDKFARTAKKSKFIYTTYDTTFLPEFSERTISRIRQQGDLITRWSCCHAGITPWVSRRSSSWMGIISARWL